MFAIFLLLGQNLVFFLTMIIGTTAPNYFLLFSLQFISYPISLCCISITFFLLLSHFSSLFSSAYQNNRLCKKKKDSFLVMNKFCFFYSGSSMTDLNKFDDSIFGDGALPIVLTVMFLVCLKCNSSNYL